ncbi:MAG TPA: 8-oxoguanine deaminase [Ignavibacteriales bacterium]|nr:8-oxoguanine deaminase [Ignavibacteriales bacterium]
MLLLKNCSFIAMPEDGKIIKNSDILVEGNRIKSIGKDLWADTDSGKTLDCTGCIVVPGLVNTHHHFFQTLTRNLKEVQNAKLFDWLKYLYKIWKNIDEEAVYFSTMTAVGELLKTGCTLTTDHHYLYPEGFQGDLMGIQFEAACQLGIRFSPSRGSMSLGESVGGLPPDSVVQSEDVILEDSLRVIEKFHDAGEGSMRKIVLAPCSPFSVTKENMKRTAELARRYRVRLHTHLAETMDEEAFCNEMFGKNPLGVMEEVGFLGEDVFFAHGVHFNDEELMLLSETKTSIAHCPSSNMRLGSGVARISEMLNLGVKVGLGVDGSASNDTSDMLGELRNALLLQRVKYGAQALSSLDVFKMATENGAQILNYPMTGKIKPGYLADLAVFDLNKLEYTGSLSDPLAALIFAGISHQTKYTVVNGKVVVENGYLTGEDEEYLIKKGNEASTRLLGILN